MKSRQWISCLVAVFVVFASGCTSVETATPSPLSLPAKTEFATATATAAPIALPASYTLISQESMFAMLEDLSSIGAYSGWRNSATTGEGQALDYVAEKLKGFEHLQALGLELERESFTVILATEIWESRLFLSRDGQESEVPANAVSGNRKDIRQALRFDSDGALNDTENNPVEASGGAVVLRTAAAVHDLATEEAEGSIVFLDFDLMDPMMAEPGAGAMLVKWLIDKQIAGLVLVVSGGKGESAQDGTLLEDTGMEGRVPMLVVRLEDLAPAGAGTWGGLESIETARLTWDTDVFSPGHSGNLVARIPGADPSRAVILGAHIDSANTPGAGDNGFNCVALLEVARVINEGHVQPPVDIYLAWFGSEELGFYGSEYFVNTHQEVLDRSAAAILLDSFTAWDPGPTILAMQEASFANFGDSSMPVSDALTEKAEGYGIPIEMTLDSEFFSSDDGSFYGFVPAARFLFGNKDIGERFHTPYDTVENLQDQGYIIEQVATMALVTALEIPEMPDMRVTPPPERQALIIATHTEAVHMTPPLLSHLDRALAMEGFDVDVIPYGQSFSAADLAGAGLVVVLPVIDYPCADSNVSLYDEQWQRAEISALVDYVAQGGFLVLTNSANRLFLGRVLEPNEDWEDMNALGAHFGITYGGTPILGIRAFVSGEHPITGDIFDLVVAADNALPVSMEDGIMLADAQGQATLGLVDYGDAGGQVLAVSDLTMLDLYNPREPEKDNLELVWNLARYVRER